MIMKTGARITSADKGIRPLVEPPERKVCAKSADDEDVSKSLGICWGRE